MEKIVASRLFGCESCYLGVERTLHFNNATSRGVFEQIANVIKREISFFVGICRAPGLSEDLEK